MFTIDLFEQRGDQWFIRIHCRYIDSEVLVEESTCASKRAAMNWFSCMATEFLQGQIGQFIEIVQFIRPHYFDKSSTPYMLLAHDWRRAYWLLNYELFPKFQELHNMPGAYAKYIKNNINVFEDLIPSLVELGRVELQFILTDIKKLIHDILETLHRIEIKDKNLIKNDTSLLSRSQWKKDFFH